MRAAAVALVTALALGAPVRAAPPPTLDSDVAGLLADGPPGMAVAIVEDGRTSLAKGYGTRRIGSSEPVGPGTLFEIGSTSKAFTAAALAILVEEGKLKWDDRVVDHMPAFQMHDPWVTREMQVKDLLVHRSGLGLGAGDLTFVPRTTHSRAEVMGALRWLKPETSFRTTFAYSNLMYVAAGQLIETVSGQSWEQFVEARILTPAGMAGSFALGQSRFDSPRGADRAQPHARLGPPFRGVGAISMLDERNGLGPNAGAAGAIASSANDMARWIATQLAKGQVPGGKRLWTEATADQMWQAVTPIPTRPPQGPLADAQAKFGNYALGWFVRDYHGERVVTHAGGTLGFITEVVLLPERNVGFVIVQNSEDVTAAQTLMFRLLDHYTGRPPADWAARFRAKRAEDIAAGEKALASRTAPATVLPRSLPTAAYAGRYRDAWYGPVTVTAKGETLTLDFTKTPGMVSRLEPFTGDSFVARWTDPTIEPAIISFRVGPDQKVSGATLKAWSPIADFSFDYHNLDLRPERAAP